MIRLLLSLFRPLASISRDIRILRELYEAELAQRDNPIVRMTERPRKSDTVVSYTGDPEDRIPKYKRWMPFGPDGADGD